jgi:hypothetical protein
MFWKLTAVIVAVAVGATALLGLRQERFDTANQLVQATCRIDQTRRALWERQAQLAARVSPRSLSNAVALAQLKLEPLVPLTVIKPPAQPQGPQHQPQTPAFQPPAATVFVSAHHRTHRG